MVDPRKGRGVAVARQTSSTHRGLPGSRGATPWAILPAILVPVGHRSDIRRSQGGGAITSSRRDHMVRRGVLAIYCISCLTMASISAAALAVALGVAGARPILTPLDDFLNFWGLPLLVGSVILLLWTMRRAPWQALALVGAGGMLTIGGMLAMAPASSTSMPGMDTHAGHVAVVIPSTEVALIFWAGAALLAFGYAWAWRLGRSGRGLPKVPDAPLP